jgi:hypothetical protein
VRVVKGRVGRRGGRGAEQKRGVTDNLGILNPPTTRIIKHTLAFTHTKKRARARGSESQMGKRAGRASRSRAGWDQQCVARGHEGGPDKFVWP